MLKGLSRRLSSKSALPADEDRSVWGPILITIGPQCSGKTTFVQSLGEPVAEYVLEDSQGIVEKAPVNCAIHMWTKDFTTEDECPEITAADRAIMNTEYYGISLNNRLSQMSNSEQMLLTLLFNREITFGYFTEKAESIINDEELRRMFIEVAAEIYDKGFLMTSSHLEVVIVEALADVKAKVAAEVDMAMRLNPNIIAWGNTNLSPDFYKETLSFAAKHSRVVRFVRWGQELPSVPLRELMVRNVKRFLKTGRYASITKLSLFHQHAERLKTANKGSPPSHYDCARSAGYDMDMMGRVTPKTEDSEKRQKAARRMSTGSSSPMPEIKETKWSKWTNENQVYALQPVAVPVNAEEINEDKLIGDDGRVINNQSTIFRQLDGRETPLGSLSGRRAKPYDGEVPLPISTPAKEKSENPFACVLCL